MSASLVGSEMCIRDREQRPDRSRTGARPDRSRTGAGATPRHMLHKCNEPVSYTHLTLPTICSV
eukprot:11144491-Alexandrium_andersonii.AAC.1